MNIYISIEISIRELDGNLLLASLAAAKGHQVIISDLEGIIKGIKNGLLAPGIFHTKSLTPADHKIARHKFIIKKGFMITSIDEEAGLDIKGHTEFAKTRYSEETIAQSSAVFCWGDEDEDLLKKIYPNLSSKIYKTGSPRVDLWKSIFTKYWGVPKKTPNRPFLLVSSNMNRANIVGHYHELVKMRKMLGYYEKTPEEFKKDFVRVGEDFNRTYAFIEAVKYIAKNNNGFDIVFRPHPMENFQAWDFYLNNIPNVYVIRDDSISAWVNNAFAIMHNRCTTAVEATISKKPVVTYVPFKTVYYDDTPSNKLGYRVETLKDLTETINNLFSEMKSGNKENKYEDIPETISRKVYFDRNELAAEKIVKVWSDLSKENVSKSQNWFAFKWLLKLIKLRKMPSMILKSLSPNKQGSLKENQKFPPLNKNHIQERLTKLHKILGIEGIKCEFLSDRTILIKRD